MFIKKVTVEITDKCNARCPQCMRTNPQGCIPNWSVTNTDITINNFKKLVPENFLKNLDIVDFNCPKGDPASHSNIFSILDYIITTKDTIQINFPTNGSLRSEKYWQKLASYKQLHTTFAIDGTDQATHEFYRRNTNYDKILRNAKAYINAGGVAEWQFIIFDHNKDQVNRAKELSRSLGFKNFRSLISNRFNKINTFNYTYKNIDYCLKSYNKKNNSSQIVSHIDCRYLQNKHLFIDINGYMMSCCFHAGSLFSYLYNPKKDHFNNFKDVSFENYNTDNFNVFKVGFDEAFKNYENYLEDLKIQWKKLDPSMCKTICGKS